MCFTLSLHHSTSNNRTPNIPLQRDAMTTWRERGYVPASDGEDSEEELETQEEVQFPLQRDTPVALPEPREAEILHDGGDTQNLDEKRGSDAVSMPSVTEDGGVVIDGESEKDDRTDGPVGPTKGGEVEARHVPDVELVDIDEIMLVAAQPRQAIEGIPTENPIVPLTGNAAADLGNHREEAEDDEDGGVGLQVCVQLDLASWM